MFARKGEGTIDLLNRRRQDYQNVRKAVRHFSVVDADRPLETVTAEVRNLICQFPSDAPVHATSSSLAS